MRSRTLLATYATSGLAIVLALASSVAIARFLGPEARGQLMAIAFWPYILSALLCFAINESTAYHVAQDSAAADSAVSNSFCATGLLLQLAWSAMLVPVVIAILPFVLRDRGVSNGSVALFASVYIPLMFIDLHFKAVMQGRGKFRALNGVRLIQPFGYSLSLILLHAMSALTVGTAMVAIVGPMFASATVGWAVGGTGLRGASWASTRSLLATGWHFHLPNLLSYGGSEVDKLIVLSLLDNRQIGYYSVALAVGGVGSTLVLQSLIVTLTSEMSRAKSSEDRLAVISSNLNDAAILLAAINGFAVVTAAWWLPFVFGEQYRSVLDITAPMLLAGTLKTLRLVIDRALRAMRQTVNCMIAEAIAFAGICCFGFAGAQWAGLKGFVWGVALAQLCGLATLTLGAARQLGVRWPELLPLRDLSRSRLLNLLARG